MSSVSHDPSEIILICILLKYFKSDVIKSAINFFCLIHNIF